MRLPFNRARIDKLAEYLRDKNFPMALEALELGLEKDPENMIWREQRASALAWLERALERGLGRRRADAGLLEDADLAHLHGNTEFEAIADEVRRRVEAIKEKPAEG